MKKNRILIGLFVLFTSFCFNCTTLPYTVELWPKGIIFYTFSKSYSLYDKLFIENCMDEWEKNTNIDFQYYYGRDENFYVLRILRNKNIEDSTSSATVGYCFEPIIIFGAMSRGVVLHELGHVLGLLHEHQRPDRDKYIKILYKNIDPDFYSCFEKYQGSEFLYNYKQFPYDYYSIMHYYNLSFSKNEEPVISTPPGVGPTGNTEISPIDILKVNKLYGKSKK